MFKLIVHQSNSTDIVPNDLTVTMYKPSGYFHLGVYENMPDHEGIANIFATKLYPTK